MRRDAAPLWWVEAEKTCPQLVAPGVEKLAWPASVAYRAMEQFRALPGWPSDLFPGLPVPVVFEAIPAVRQLG